MKRFPGERVATDMKRFLGSGLDGRTVGPGTLAGTVSMTVVMFAFFGFGGVFDVVGMIALSFLFASVPAGIVVGILGRSSGDVTKDGGLAAVFATILSTFSFGLIGAVLARGVPVAYRLDVVFVTVGFGLVTYLFVIPPTFLMGSWVAGRTARSVRRLAGEVDDEWAEVGTFSDSRE